ncbi:MAG: UbiX family flavin prenyltransferase [Bacteroidales bacterium]
MQKKNIILAITGASGSIYAKLLIKQLEKHQSQLDNVACLFSKNAPDIWQHELNQSPSLPSFITTYELNDFHSPLASGSSKFDTMIICPCSMGTLGRIAAGTSDDLLLRAADVMLKEKRKLILVPRETPFSLIHLRNMNTLSEAGATIIPAIPSFYSKPETIEDVAMTVVERILAHVGIEGDGFVWGG